MQYYTSPFNKEEEYKFPKNITIYDTVSQLFHPEKQLQLRQ